MIKLLNILQIPKCDFKHYKIHFATGSKNKREPYEKFLTDEFQDWQECQTKKNFSRKYVLSLIYYERDVWLFAGVYEVLPIAPIPLKKENWVGWKYETRLIDVQKDYIGRIFVRYEKKFRASYPRLELNCENPPSEMEVYKISEEKHSIAEFHGFDNTNISYSMLKAVIEKKVPSWKNALSNVKGVYHITDRKTGKHYVGSAYGNDCLWQRWSAYAKNGHGNNEELLSLLKKEGENYKYNFQYAILEICNMNMGNPYVLDREQYWKEVLHTREFGLNKN